LATLPWSAIATAGIIAAAAAVNGIANAVQRRRDRAISGDQAVIAKFMRRAARWSSRKRKRIADGLWKDYQKHRAKGERKAHGIGRRGQEKQDTTKWKAKDAVLKMKMAVLYRLEHDARKNPRARLVPDDPATIPESADRIADDGVGEQAETGTPLATASSGTTDVPWTPILLAGGAVLIGGILLTRGNARGGGDYERRDRYRDEGHPERTTKGKA
jgi:hypothetical protein